MKKIFSCQPQRNGTETASVFRKNEAKFTLIELLIVVAIIAILAGMLLPALNHARDTAKKIKCVNNEKGLLRALTLYSDTYNGYLPPNCTASNFTNKGFSGKSYFYDAYYMKPLLGSGYAKVLRCPSRLNDANDKDKSYGMHNTAFENVKQIRKGSSYLLLTDYGYATCWYRNDYTRFGDANEEGYKTTPQYHVPWKRHANFVNAGFLDGHVESVGKAAFIQNHKDKKYGN